MLKNLESQIKFEELLKRFVLIDNTAFKDEMELFMKEYSGEIKKDDEEDYQRGYSEGYDRGFDDGEDNGREEGRDEVMGNLNWFLKKNSDIEKAITKEEVVKLIKDEFIY